MIYCSGKDIRDRLWFAWHLNSSLCVVCVTFAEFVQRGAVPMVCIEYISKYVLGKQRNIVAYKRQGLPGSNALDFALWLRDVACTSSQRKDVRGLWPWHHPPHSTRKAQRVCAIRGNASPPLPYKHTGTALAKKAPLVWSCFIPNRSWRKRIRGQIKTCATTFNLERFSGPLCTKGRVYQAVVRSILFYGCQYD